MNLSRKPARCLQTWLLGPALLLAVLAMSGCQTLSYYGQAIKGQYQIVAHEQKIEKLLADPQTPAPLKAKLQLVQDLRAFAAKDLQLPVDGHYEKYADLHRPFVVWTVEAAPEFSLEPKTWWYPFTGSLEYRGYFAERSAQEYAARLQKKGYDVYVGGVAAYSTLGWFKDPLLNTFISDPEPDLAETIFHELGHQRVFASGDTDFNEAFATTVGQEGARRWLQAKGNQAALEKYLAEIRQTTQFAHLITSARERLETLYGNQQTEGASIKTTKEQRAVLREEWRQQKQALFDQLRREYTQLKVHWGGDTDYDKWFARPLNNAQLNSVAAYYDLVPGFEQLLKLNGGDLAKFYEAADKLAHEPKAEREQRLRSLGSEAGVRFRFDGHRWLHAGPVTLLAGQAFSQKYAILGATIHHEKSRQHCAQAIASLGG
jgi:predicted aminopeptidase